MEKIIQCLICRVILKNIKPHDIKEGNLYFCGQDCVDKHNEIKQKEYWRHQAPITIK